MRSPFTQLTQTITGAAILLSIASLGSRVLGLVRDRIFAHYFGAGATLDAYYAAFKIPDFLFNLIILGALSAGFIPVFTKYLHEQGKESAARIVHTCVSIAFLTLGSIGALLMLVAPKIVPLLAPGFSASQQELTITLTRIMMLSPLLLGVSAVLGGVLQSLKHFLAFSLAPITYNLGIIIGATVFYPLFGISGLAWGVVLGAAAHCATQFIAVSHADIRLKWSLHITPEVCRIGQLMIPRTIGLAVSQMNALFLTSIASTLAVGSIAVVQFAGNIAAVPIGIFAISYAVAAFPTFSSQNTANDRDGFIASFSSTVRQIIFLLIPATVIAIILRAQIVRVLLGSGAFNWDDTTRTFDTLAFIAGTFVAQGLIHVLVRAFYSFENTVIPVTVAFISEIISLGVAWYASRTMGVVGIGLGISVGASVQIILLWILLRFKTHSLDEKRIVYSIFKMTIAALAMAMTMQYLKKPIASVVNMHTGLGVFTQLFAVTLFGSLIYLIVGLLLRTHEMQVFAAAIREKLIGRKNLPNDISDIHL